MQSVVITGSVVKFSFFPERKKVLFFLNSDRINVEDANGDRLVRIHGIGFPTIFAGPTRFQQSVYRYSTLMREMTLRNGGTFVGLNDYQ